MLGSFVIFYFLIKKLIEKRLKILYRSIRKGKFEAENKSRNFRLSDDVITEAERQTKSWTEERNNELSKLKEQEQFRREFLGNLAHELKTPVFAIQGYLLTLLDGGLEDENVNRLFLERASKATDRMGLILDDLDQITRLEENKLQMDMRIFDIIELIQDIFDTVESKAKRKKISLNIAKDYGQVIVEADRSKIGQVLTNLISNAISYGNEKGEVSLRIYLLDNIVTVEVADNGPGIDDVNLPRLFERFYRVEKSRNRNEGGSGLGLSIVKHIIESHDQNINVRSTVGVGSTFAFTLKKSKLTSVQKNTLRGISI
ncbi:MAG: two-component system phosphate regulon sensor histidine kinase PhoR [Lentimonas sp.]|jgi:two-component system phosphate regulon sensor histidine kinase PhoR